MKSPFNIINAQVVYENSHVACHVDTLEKDGKQWEQAYIAKPTPDFDVGIIPYDEEKQGVYMVRQYRHANERFFWQFPGGMGEKGESIIEIAHRELTEETGLTAKKMEVIGLTCNEPGLVRLRTTILVATGLSTGQQCLEHDEAITRVRFISTQDVERMIVQGEFQCGFALAAWTFFRSYVYKG